MIRAVIYARDSAAKRREGFLARLSGTYRELVENLGHIPERHIPRASSSGMTGGHIV